MEIQLKKIIDDLEQLRTTNEFNEIHIHQFNETLNRLKKTT